MSVLLPNGRVLIAGGYTLGPTGTATACADVFDPVSNSVTAITPMRAARGAFFGLLLPDGRVLVAGALRSIRSDMENPPLGIQLSTLTGRHIHLVNRSGTLRIPPIF